MFSFGLPGEVANVTAEALGVPVVPTQFAEDVATRGLELALAPGLCAFAQLGKGVDVEAFNGLDADDTWRAA